MQQFISFQHINQNFSGSNKVSISTKWAENILAESFETKEQKVTLAVLYSGSALKQWATQFL